jgi:hypothetical protein
VAQERIVPFQKLSGFTGVVAHFGVCQGASHRMLFQEIFGHRDHPLGFRKKDEVAGIRDYGKFSVRDSLRSVGGVPDADKIVITDHNEHRRFNRGQLFVRKSLPANASDLLPNLGPIFRIRSHFLVHLFLI